MPVALIVFDVGVVGWRALEGQRDIGESNAALQSISAYANQAVKGGPAGWFHRQQQQRQRLTLDRSRRELAGNQRCVGGPQREEQGDL